MFRGLKVTLAGIILAGTVLVPLGLTQRTSPAAPAKTGANAAKIAPGDWPMYGRDLTSSRYSPLTQISRANVSKLAKAWSYRPAPPAGSQETGGGRGRGRGGAAGVVTEATPIVVNGVMFLPAGNQVVALDADTGKEIWSHRAEGGNVQTRSVGYWPGDGTNPARVLYTVGTKMFALNAATGNTDPGFGKEGVVDIEITWGGAPYVYKNLIIMGNNNGERSDGPAGDTKVYDARTGAELWRFKTMVQPGDKNYPGSWLNHSDEHSRAGLNVWGWYFTVDEQRDLLYMPVGGPAGNYYGGDRPGNNLYGNSIVAVNATTGKYVWHFQLVHHDLWDSDLPAAPSLFDVKKDGKTIPALAVISKNALMFILNRETGEPIYGVEERPVPKGDVPGEWYSPTQPFPLKPPPLVRMSFNKAEDFVRASDTTPEHVKACEEYWDRAGGFINEGPFTPFGFHEAGAPPKSYVQFPGVGSPNWGGTAADPTTGYIYVGTSDSALTGWIEKKVAGGNYGALTDGSPLPMDRGSVNGPGPYNQFSAGGMPCQRPPWARLYAINANTGDIAWKVTLGINERLPKEKQNVGSIGGAGSTVTAGGLLFTATNDTWFHALDSKTGRELWSVKLDANMNANPMTYTGKSGKQYVAGVSGGAVVAFALQ
ncbi:MAG TPA: PQQ-binding-like beta-propeller repeat protein [Bryobacteraceae bacterium]|nr:PQQ-binding-like beta-propeller repeat protein [Bryobacteraceae bacterium]